MIHLSNLSGVNYLQDAGTKFLKGYTFCFIVNRPHSRNTELSVLTQVMVLLVPELKYIWEIFLEENL